MKKLWSEAKTKSGRKRIYILILPTIRKVARKNGYAIGLHGSMTRDLDLIAVPWVSKHATPNSLAHQIHKAVVKYAYSLKSVTAKNVKHKKPRGRIAYSLILGPGGAYIDLSVKI